MPSCQHRPPCTHGNGQNDYGQEFMQTTPAHFKAICFLHGRCPLQMAGSSHNGDFYILASQQLRSRVLFWQLVVYLPEMLVPDNDTIFNSDEFQKIMDRNGIQQICTSPYYPTSKRLGREGTSEHLRVP